MEIKDLPKHYFHTTIDEAVADPDYQVVSDLQKKLIKDFTRRTNNLYKYIMKKSREDELVTTKEVVNSKKFKEYVTELNLIRTDWRVELTDLMDEHKD